MNETETHEPNRDEWTRARAQLHQDILTTILRFMRALGIAALMFCVAYLVGSLIPTTALFGPAFDNPQVLDFMRHSFRVALGFAALGAVIGVLSLITVPVTAYLDGIRTRAESMARERLGQRDNVPPATEGTAVHETQ